MNSNIGISSGDHINLRNELIMISQEIDKTYPAISRELFRLKDAVLWQTGFINPVILGELIALIRFLKEAQEDNEFWDMLHPTIIRVSRRLYEDGHYADAAEDAFIEINSRVKKVFRILNPSEVNVPDGVAAMNRVFSENKSLISLTEDITT